MAGGEGEEGEEGEEEEDAELPDAPAIDSFEYLEIHFKWRNHPNGKIYGVKKGPFHAWFGKGEDTLAELHQQVWDKFKGQWMVHYAMKPPA